MIASLIAAAGECYEDRFLGEICDNSGATTSSIQWWGILIMVAIGIVIVLVAINLYSNDREPR